MRIVSSFGPQGYELYGKTFIESTLEHWPGELWIYYEDQIPDVPDSDRIVLKNLFDVPGCREYLQVMSTLPIFQGIINNKRVYQLDIFRFCRKMFAQVDAATNYEGLLFWLDADTETFSDISEDTLRNYLNNTFMCYMGRNQWHSCASFVGWDNSHPIAKQWWGMLYDFYLTGKVLTQNEWHDSYILDVLREGQNIPSKDLAEPFELDEGPVNVFDIVFSGLATHYKGNKKFEAASNG